jgi:hypothetical protein
MDPLEPIAGISLERYAELAAKMKDCGGDLEVCVRIAAENGVDRSTWESAMNGWNARMYDPQTAGTVAIAYMPLYQEALLKYGGPAAEASYEDYIEMTAMINSGEKSLDKMYARFNIDPVKWSQISTFWVGKLTTDLALGSDFSDKCNARIEELNAEYAG